MFFEQQELSSTINQNQDQTVMKIMSKFGTVDGKFVLPPIVASPYNKRHGKGKKQQPV